MITLLRTFFSSLAVISMSCRGTGGGVRSRTEGQNMINNSLSRAHISSYLLKNSPELLVLLALLARGRRRRLRREEVEATMEDVTGKS